MTIIYSVHLRVRLYFVTLTLSLSVLITLTIIYNSVSVTQPKC